MSEVSEFAGRRVLVVGLGSSGYAAARALRAEGARVRVTEVDDSQAIRERAATLYADGIDVEIGGHDLESLDADVAVVSPGIAPGSAIVEALRAAAVSVISEVELAYRLARCDFLAVTGTNGKTTTTSLLAGMLDQGGISSVAAGNIGFPVVDAISSVPEDGAIALEVSSFQLAAIERFAPRVAVLLNVAEDHTDWHGDARSYAAAKARIFENQSPDDTFVVNAGDPVAWSLASQARSRVVPFSSVDAPHEGIGVRDGFIVWRDQRIAAVDDVPLDGIAGLEDALAAAGAALEYGVDTSAVERGLRAFRPLAHRLQRIAELRGVAYIDDSKATNPHATLAAVAGLNTVVLIAGGRAKGIDLGALAAAVPPVVAVVALGEAADDIARVFDGLVPVERALDMDDAVRRAASLVPPGGSVLLSPGCASLDMYDSYAARGDAFARAVDGLQEEVRQGG